MLVPQILPGIEPTKVVVSCATQVQRYNKALAGEDVPDEEEMLAGGKDAAVKAAAKGKLLSHVVKRNVMQVALCDMDRCRYRYT
jgi:hypothetical protein